MYNISLNLSYKNVLFIGGGKVAERKIKSIIDENCKITVIAPQTNDYISNLVEKSRVTVIKREFEPNDVSKKYFMVFAATDDVELNRLIYEKFNDINVLCNNVSDGEYTNFISSATAKFKNIVISINTVNKDPLLSKEIKNMLISDIENNTHNFENRIKCLYYK